MSLRLRRGGAGTGVPAQKVYGPTAGPQAIRDGASPGAVTVFPGTPGTNFTQLNPGNSKATNQAAITNDTTGKVWWPKGTYNVTGSAYTFKTNTEYRWESAAGFARSATDTAVMSGPGNVTGSFDAASVTSSTFKGGKWQNFTSGLTLLGGVLLEDVEITTVFNTGIGSLGSNNRITRCWTHSNGKYGITASTPTPGTRVQNVILENSRINENNARNLDPTIDAGGTKFLFIDGMIVRSCWVETNYGSGLWWDTDCINLLCEENVVENQFASTAPELKAGMFYEACQGGTIFQHNLLLNNGSTNGNFGNANFQISSGEADQGGNNAIIQVTLNKFDTASGAIVQCSVYNGHGPPVGTRLSHGCHIEDNEIWLRGTATSKVGGSSAAADLGGHDNTFSQNQYHVASLSTDYWHWNTAQYTPRSWATWQGFGFDTGGSGATRVVI